MLSFNFKTQTQKKYDKSVTLAVSNLRVVFGVGSEDPEEFGLTLNGFWTVPHQRAVSWERSLYGTSQINVKYRSHVCLLSPLIFPLHSFNKIYYDP